jgi:hypothetical protein
MQYRTLPLAATTLSVAGRPGMHLTMLILGLSMLLAGLGVALAEETVTVNGEKYVLKEVLRQHTVLERLRDGLQYCPTLCYTDTVQHTVIACRAPAILQGGDGPPLDRQGNYTGPSNQWTITETHDIREIRVSEKACQQTRAETIIEVLGSQPRYFPGDPQIEDPRSPYDPPFSRFNCNDYPAQHDATTNELVAIVEVDLLIKHQPLFCR